MPKLVCSKCMKVYDGSENGRCPHCGSGPPQVYEFRNSDEYLKEQIPRVLEERKKAGLDGLVGGLEIDKVTLKAEFHRANSWVYLVRKDEKGI